MIQYFHPLTLQFEKFSNPGKAIQMKKYMKNLFEYYGIAAPVRQDISRQFISQYGLAPSEELEFIIDELWNLPEREYQYFGMELAARYIKKSSIHDIHLYEKMIAGKSWWDTVDFIAAKLVGAWLQKFPDQIPVYTQKWIESGNIWLQRTALLFQLKYKHRTDPGLLEKIILQLNTDQEFFIRKAIGWILREYSKTNPAWVTEFIQTHPLSVLSKREGLKIINKSIFV